MFEQDIGLKRVLILLLRGIAAVVMFLLTFALLFIVSFNGVSRLDSWYFRLGHMARVTAVAFSPDGRVLASASAD